MPPVVSEPGQVIDTALIYFHKQEVPPAPLGALEAKQDPIPALEVPEEPVMPNDKSHSVQV